MQKAKGFRKGTFNLIAKSLLAVAVIISATAFFNVHSAFAVPAVSINIWDVQPRTATGPVQVTFTATSPSGVYLKEALLDRKKCFTCSWVLGVKKLTAPPNIVDWTG